MPAKSKLYVLNPRGISKERPILRHHICVPKPNEGHTNCDDRRWFEGDAFDPNERPGMDTKRFLSHMEMPGATCADKHENCAGPFVGPKREVKDG